MLSDIETSRARCLGGPPDTSNYCSEQEVSPLVQIVQVLSAIRAIIDRAIFGFPGEITMNGTLQILRDIKVDSPCAESWESMNGDHVVRFCDICRHRVHNLSEMTPRQAAAVLQTAEGRICIRYETTPDGSIKTRGRMAPIRELTAGAVRAIASMAAVIGLTTCVGGCNATEKRATAATSKPAVVRDRSPQSTIGVAAFPLPPKGEWPELDSPPPSPPPPPPIDIPG